MSEEIVTKILKVSCTTKKVQKVRFHGDKTEKRDIRACTISE